VAAAPARVVAVVVTHDRVDMVLECVAALGGQTHPLEAIVIVDVASSDGTLEQVRARCGDLPLRLVRLERNGGGAEGFHAGVREALGLRPDWIWLMDDDCEALPGTLADLLDSSAARYPGTAAVLPAVRSAAGRPLPLHRGHIGRRWFLAPLHALAADEAARAEVEVSMGTFVGALVRGEAARAAGLPLREAFIRLEDVEYLTRVRRSGAMWLVNRAVIVHKEPEAEAVTSLGLGHRLRDFTARRPFAQEWKRLYSLRNMIWAGRVHGYVSAGQALSYALVHLLRALAFAERRRRTAFLVALYAYDGWRGRFRNVPPDRWPALAEAPDPVAFLRTESLRYERSSSSA
jgi:rhamnopyranosyl-N-acetylglucosaminyl-diphospho-decaprenol beta-1,3/1,4-galactofuranosyltransferase